jgi:hypothetical protein
MKKSCLPFLKKIFKILFLWTIVNFLFYLDTVDLYISTKKERIWIVDFNVFGSPTESLLFDDWKFNEYSFKIIEKDYGVHPSLSMYSRLPYDLLNYDQQKIKEFFDEAEVDKTLDKDDDKD